MLDIREIRLVWLIFKFTNRTTIEPASHPPPFKRIGANMDKMGKGEGGENNLLRSKKFCFVPITLLKNREKVMIMVMMIREE